MFNFTRHVQRSQISQPVLVSHSGFPLKRTTDLQQSLRAPQQPSLSAALQAGSHTYSTFHPGKGKTFSLRLPFSVKSSLFIFLLLISRPWVKSFSAKVNPVVLFLSILETFSLYRLSSLHNALQLHHTSQQIISVPIVSKILLNGSRRLQLVVPNTLPIIAWTSAPLQNHTHTTNNTVKSIPPQLSQPAAAATASLAIIYTLFHPPLSLSNRNEPINGTRWIQLIIWRHGVCI